MWLSQVEIEHYSVVFTGFSFLVFYSQKLISWCIDGLVDVVLSVDWSKAKRIRQKRSSHVIGAYV